MKLDTLLADANGRYESFEPKIMNAAKRAELYVNRKLHLSHNINLIFSDMRLFLIPEDGVGGRTYWYDFILMTIDLEKDPSEDILFEMICHEIAHAARWSKNTEQINTLFDGVINEGLATVFEETAVKENKLNHRQVFLDTVAGRTSEDNGKILTALKKQLDNANYDYDEVFFDGNSELPRWSGYSLGYFLVKKYLIKTHKTIDQALFDNYADFRIIL